MKLFMTTTALVAAVAFPAFAQDAGMDYATMTCADFLAMDETGMTEAMTAMQAAMEADGGAAAATDTAATDTAAADTMATDEAAGTEDMAADAGATDDAAATDMAAADTAATGDDMAVTDTETTAADTTAAEAGAADADPMMAAVRTSCEGAPDSLVMDAMMAAHAGAP